MSFSGCGSSLAAVMIAGEKVTEDRSRGYAAWGWLPALAWGRQPISPE
ncbi:hypothetical protein PVA48_02625 [Akkermansia sp. JRP_AM1]